MSKKFIDPRNAVEIATANPDPIEMPDAQFIKTPYTNLSFYINPNAMQVGQQNISKLERVENGYVKIGFGDGLITVTFNGQMPIFFEGFERSRSYDPKQFDVENYAALQESPGWVWFQEFSTFVRLNAKFPFYLGFYGVVAQISTGNIYPVLKGDLTPPAYSQDAQNPFLLNYNFTFTGVLVDEKINRRKSETKTTAASNSTTFFGRDSDNFLV